MTTKTEETTETKTEEQNGSTSELTPEQMAERISQLEGINKEVISERDSVKVKLREREQADETEQAKKLEEQGEYKSLLEAERAKYTNLQGQLQQRDIDVALTSALKQSGLDESALGTAMKLVDRDAVAYDIEKGVDVTSITTAVSALKTEHEILFSSKPKTPEPKRAEGNSDLGDYQSELKKLVESGEMTKPKLTALRKKHGKN